MKKTKTRYCKYYNICDKDINCFKGEYCAVFEHSEFFTSLRYRDPDTIKREYRSEFDMEEYERR